MFCVSCGSVIGSDFRFCEYCGMPVAEFFDNEEFEAEVNETNDLMRCVPLEPDEADHPESFEEKPVCAKCGYELQEDSKFCDRCGYPVGSEKQESDKMLSCKKCGRELEPDSLFCDKCGALVAQEEESPVTIRCKKCGFELEEGFIFCDRCGARQ